MATGLITALMPSAPAWAHDDDEEHAEQDLAGVPVKTIEKDTAANARRLGRVDDEPTRNRASVGADVAADPGVSGTWTAPTPTSVLPVFQAVLPNGKVLMWDSVGDGATESYPDADHVRTRAMVWNPETDTAKTVDVQGYNIFCAGYVQLPNGNVLVVGGNKNAALDGIRQTHVFDWRAETWSRGPDMAAERWYPSVAALANGEAVIVAGGSNRAEVYQTDGALRTLTGFTTFGDRTYPFLVPRNDGRVELVGPVPGMSTLNTEGIGTLDAAATRDGINRDYGSFATYLPGRTLVTGGGDLTEKDANGVEQTRVPTRTSVVVDTTGTGTTVSAAKPMAFPRKQHNLTVLADGSVLATGGQRKTVNSLVDLANPVLAAERWDPASDTWTTLAAAAKVREYHSTAALLPDGRVLTGGGGICGVCVSQGYLEKNVETFTPPYLYKKDGSGQLATRPTITAAPTTAAVGSTFSLSSPVASSIRKLGLVRLGAPTHSVDQGQRYVPLTYTAGATSLAVTAPATGAVAPPGYYMLFAVDAQGVPSVARMLQITAPAAPPARPNLALNKPATASSAEATPALGAAKANDGDITTRWASASTDDEWWQVDLGREETVDTVVTAWEAAYAKRFAVQTSVDGTTFATATTVDAASAGTQRTTFSARPARYVRIAGLARGTTWGYSLFETQVFGSTSTPTDSPPVAAAGPDQAVTPGVAVTLDGSGSRDPDGSALTYRWTQTGGPAVTLAGATSARPTFTAPATASTLTFALTVNDGRTISPADSVTVSVRANLALNKAAQASTVQSSPTNAYLANRGNDGSGTTRWSSQVREGQWWRVDLGTDPRTIDTVVTSWEAAYAKRFVIETSTNGTSYTTAATVDATAAGRQTTTFPARSARYVRVRCVTRGTQWGISLWETQVFGR